jgi:hypothetical protein
MALMSESGLGPNLTDAWTRLVEDCRLRRYLVNRITDEKKKTAKLLEAKESIDLSAHVVFDLTPVLDTLSEKEEYRWVEETANGERLPLLYPQCAVILHQPESRIVRSIRVIHLSPQP